MLQNHENLPGTKIIKNENSTVIKNWRVLKS